MSYFWFFMFFSVYSVIGWTVDTTYRSCVARRFKRGGFSKYPFSPVYGLGALLALALAPFIRQWPLWLEGLSFTLAMGAYEYVSGVVVVRVFRRRLWDYSDSFGNFHGHTALGYALVWGLLALNLVYVLHPFLASVVAPSV